MSKSDLDILAERVHEAPNGTEWGSYVGGGIMWFADMPNPAYFEGNSYLIEQIIAHRDKLSGKPTAWVNDWARWRAQDKNGQWWEYGDKPSEGIDHWCCNCLLEYINCVSEGQVFGDWRDTLEERDMDHKKVEAAGNAIQEMEASISKPQWKEGELPPVGEQVEIWIAGDEWRKGVVIYHDRLQNINVAVVKHNSNCYDGFTEKCIRPIKSERERVIEELAKELQSYDAGVTELSNSLTKFIGPATAIYDKFIAEKG